MDVAKKLQDFFVDAKVPGSWRDRVPLVCSPLGILWVVGYRIGHAARVMPTTRRVLRIDFEKACQRSGSSLGHSCAEGLFRRSP
jgi:hypothetical protein